MNQVNLDYETCTRGTYLKNDATVNISMQTSIRPHYRRNHQLSNPMIKSQERITRNANFSIGRQQSSLINEMIKRKEGRNISARLYQTAICSRSGLGPGKFGKKHISDEYFSHNRYATVKKRCKSNKLRTDRQRGREW